MERDFETIIIGGGAAGLSASLNLGRALRRTLVVDAGRPSNAPAHGIGGLLGNDGTPPLDLLAHGRRELGKYERAEVRTSTTVVAGSAGGAGVELELDDGSSVRARTVLLTPGMDYVTPYIPGIAERWGRSAFHCPFCHGFEVRGLPLGVFHDGSRPAEHATMLRAWSDDVTVYLAEGAELDAAERAVLADAGVALEERVVASLDGPDGSLVEVTFADGASRACEGILFPVRLRQRSDLAARLGVRLTEPGPMFEDAIEVDMMHATSVPGIFAAGDAAGSMPTVATAVATGGTAGAMLVRTLMA